MINKEELRKELELIAKELRECYDEFGCEKAERIGVNLYGLDTVNVTETPQGDINIDLGIEGYHFNSGGAA